jgi:hypothetical protein
MRKHGRYVCCWGAAQCKQHEVAFETSNGQPNAMQQVYEIFTAVCQPQQQPNAQGRGCIETVPRAAGTALWLEAMGRCSCTHMPPSCAVTRCTCSLPAGDTHSPPLTPTPPRGRTAEGAQPPLQGITKSNTGTPAGQLPPRRAGARSGGCSRARRVLCISRQPRLLPQSRQLMAAGDSPVHAGHGVSAAGWCLCLAKPPEIPPPDHRN